LVIGGRLRGLRLRLQLRLQKVAFFVTFRDRNRAAAAKNFRLTSVVGCGRVLFIAMKWFTKKEFRRWWKDRDDNLPRGDRGATCPLARFARVHGLLDAVVGDEFWYPTGDSDVKLPLPRWARKLVARFDTQLEKR